MNIINDIIKFHKTYSKSELYDVSYDYKNSFKENILYDNKKVKQYKKQKFGSLLRPYFLLDPWYISNKKYGLIDVYEKELLINEKKNLMSVSLIEEDTHVYNILNDFKIRLDNKNNKLLIINYIFNKFEDEYDLRYTELLTHIFNLSGYKYDSIELYFMEAPIHYVDLKHMNRNNYKNRKNETDKIINIINKNTSSTNNKIKLKYFSIFNIDDLQELKKAVKKNYIYACITPTDI